MRKLVVIAIAVVALLATAAVSAAAQVERVDPVPVDPVPVEPEPIAPLPYASVHLIGDVWANGSPIGEIDFAIIWNEDDPSHAQLWALLGDVPTQVCVGRIFETPAGEPIFFGSTSLMEPAGTCHMARLPDHGAISLFAASNDGQWAAAILRNPNRAEPVPIFE